MFKKLEKIKKEIANLANTCIIVEGVKDKIVLENLGFKNILTISNKSLISVVETIASRRFKYVTILTDFDKEGEEKLLHLTKLFKSYDIVINNSIRKFIKNSFKIHKIEELKFITKFLENDYYGRTSSISDKIFNINKFLIRKNCRKKV